MARLTLLLLVLWVGVTVSTVVDLHKRIIGGRTCANNERQFHVKLTDSKGDFLCGGSLVSPQWILTAGHCKERNLKAVLGVHPGPGTSVKTTTQKFFKDRPGDHDIMLLKLAKSTKLPTVNLPNCKSTPNVGQAVRIAGHAATTVGPGNKKICGESPTLQCALTNIVNYQVARDTFTYRAAGVDTCPGDSGGGVVYNGMIYGVHISAPRTAFTGPGEASNVCAYLDWIVKIIGKKKSILDQIRSQDVFDRE